MRKKKQKPLAEMNERELGDAKALRPKNEEELISYIQELLSRKHDYGTCVYAVSLATTATFNYMSHKLGITGFQASCADLDVLRRTRGMEEGFSILDWNKLLYPQYFNEKHFPSAFTLLKRNLKPLQKKVEKLLKEKKVVPACSAVEKHWQWILSLKRNSKGGD